MLRPATLFLDASPQSPSKDGQFVKGSPQMRDGRSVYNTVSEGELRGVPRKEKGSPACLSSLQLGVIQRNLGLSRNCKGDIFQNTGAPPRSLDVSRSGNLLAKCDRCKLLNSVNRDNEENEQKVTSESSMLYHQDRDRHLLKLDHQNENCNDLFYDESFCCPKSQSSEVLEETYSSYPVDQSEVDEATQIQCRKSTKKLDDLCLQHSSDVHSLNLDDGRTNSSSDCINLSSYREFSSSEFRDTFLSSRSPTLEDKDKSYGKFLMNTQMNQFPSDVTDLRILDRACPSEVSELDEMFPKESTSTNVPGKPLPESYYCHDTSENTKTSWVRLVQQKFTQSKQSNLDSTDSDGCHSRSHTGSGSSCRSKKLHIEMKPYRQWQRVSQVVTAESRYIISPEAYTGVTSGSNARTASWSSEREESFELGESFKSQSDSEVKELPDPGETSSLTKDNVLDRAALKNVGRGRSDPKSPDNVTVCRALSPPHLLRNDFANTGEVYQYQNLARNLSTPTFDDNGCLPENHHEHQNGTEIPIEDDTDPVLLPTTSIDSTVENFLVAVAPDSSQVEGDGRILPSGKPILECTLSPEVVRHAFASPHLFCPISPPGFSLTCESPQRVGAFFDASVLTSGAQETQACGDGNVPGGSACCCKTSSDDIGAYAVTGNMCDDIANKSSCSDMTGQNATGSSRVSEIFSGLDFPSITSSQSSGVAFPDEVFRNNGWASKDRTEPSSSFDHVNMSPTACLFAAVMASLKDADIEDNSATLLSSDQATASYAPCNNINELATDTIVCSLSLGPALASDNVNELATDTIVYPPSLGPALASDNVNELATDTIVCPPSLGPALAPDNVNELATDTIVCSPSLGPAPGSDTTDEILGVSPTGQEFKCACPETRSGDSDVLLESTEVETWGTAKQWPNSPISDVVDATIDGCRDKLGCPTSHVVSLKIATKVVTACCRVLAIISRRKSSSAPPSCSSERPYVSELEFSEAWSGQDPPAVCVNDDSVSPLSHEVDDSDVPQDANKQNREIFCGGENVQVAQTNFVSNNDMDLCEDECVMAEDDSSNLAVEVEDDTCCSEISTTFDDLVEGHCQLDLAADDASLLPALEPTFIPSECNKDDNSKMSMSSEFSEKSISATAFSHPLTLSRPGAAVNTRHISPSSGKGSSMTASSTQLSHAVNALKHARVHDILRRKNASTIKEECKRNNYGENMDNVKPLKTVSGVSEVSGPPVKSSNFSYDRGFLRISKSVYRDVGRAPKLRTAARCRIASIVDTHTSSSGITSETFSLESDSKNVGTYKIKNISLRADSKIKNSERPGKPAVGKAHQNLTRLHRGSTSGFETQRNVLGASSKYTASSTSKTIPDKCNTPKDRWKGCQSFSTLPVSYQPKVPVLHEMTNKCSKKTDGTHPRVQSSKFPETTSATQRRVQSSGQVKKAGGGQVSTECPSNLPGQRGFPKSQVNQRTATSTGPLAGSAKNTVISNCCDRWKMKSKRQLPISRKNILSEPEKQKEKAKTSLEPEKHKDKAKTFLEPEKHKDNTEPCLGHENLKDDTNPTLSVSGVKC